VLFYEAAGTEQDALLLNQFSLSTKGPLRDLYSIAENQSGYTNSSAWRANFDRRTGGA
jgi:hypothetical protein